MALHVSIRSVYKSLTGGEHIMGGMQHCISNNWCNSIVHKFSKYTVGNAKCQKGDIKFHTKDTKIPTATSENLAI
jgi:hypothetical protein